MPTFSRKILITGATGHLGRAVAAALASPDAHLCLCYRTSEEMALKLKDAIAPSCGAVDAIRADLAGQEGARFALEQSLEKMGGINVLVHMSSSFARTPLGSVDERTFREIVDANLSASFYVAQEAATPLCKEGGSIVFFTDVAARQLYRGYLPYSIAKAGTEALTIGLARELAPAVRVNAVAPYAASRPELMSDEEWRELIERTPLRRQTDPAEIASLIRWLTFEAHTTTGQIISVDGGRLLR